MTAQQITNLDDWRAAHHPASNLAATGTVWQAPVQATAVQFIGQPVFTANTGTAETGPIHAEVAIFEDGPWINWWGTDPGELQQMGRALLDAARAARNGDDLVEVARQEWERRRGQPSPG